MERRFSGSSSWPPGTATRAKVGLGIARSMRSFTTRRVRLPSWMYLTRPSYSLGMNFVNESVFSYMWLSTSNTGYSSWRSRTKNSSSSVMVTPITVVGQGPELVDDEGEPEAQHRQQRLAGAPRRPRLDGVHRDRAEHLAQLGRVGVGHQLTAATGVGQHLPREVGEARRARDVVGAGLHDAEPLAVDDELRERLRVRLHPAGNAPQQHVELLVE